MIKLPDLSAFQKALSNQDSNLVVTGWGKDGDHPSNTGELRALEHLNPLPPASEPFWQSTKGIEFFSEERYLNAYLQNDSLGFQAVNGKSACSGDSGSPLIEKTAGILLGIAAWVDAPFEVETSHMMLHCKKARAFVYTNLLHYRDWIDSQINAP